MSPFVFMLALKMEEGVIGQIQSFLEAVRGKGMDSSLKALKEPALLIS